MGVISIGSYIAVYTKKPSALFKIKDYEDNSNHRERVR